MISWHLKLCVYFGIKIKFTDVKNVCALLITKIWWKYFRFFSGYDVWLNNIRGNTYSKNHSTYDSCVSCSSFWEFRWSFKLPQITKVTRVGLTISRLGKVPRAHKEKCGLRRSRMRKKGPMKHIILRKFFVQQI